MDAAETLSTMLTLMWKRKLTKVDPFFKFIVQKHLHSTPQATLASISAKKLFHCPTKKPSFIGAKSWRGREEEDPDRREGGLGAVWVGGSKGGERANPFSDVYHTFISLSHSSHGLDSESLHSAVNIGQ